MMIFCIVLACLILTSCVRVCVHCSCGMTGAVIGAVAAVAFAVAVAPEKLWTCENPSCGFPENSSVSE